MDHETLSVKKIQSAGPSVNAFSGKKIQSVSLHHLYMSVLRVFFPEIALGDGPKNW